MKLLKLFTMVALVIFAANSILLAQKRRPADPKKEPTPVPSNEPPNTNKYQPTTATTTNQSTNATVVTVNTSPIAGKTDNTVDDNRGAGASKPKNQSNPVTVEVVQENSTESANATNVTTQPNLPAWQCDGASDNSIIRRKVGIANGLGSKATNDEVEIMRNELAKEFCGDSFELVRLVKKSKADYILEAKRLNCEYIIVMEVESLNQSSEGFLKKAIGIATENAGSIIKETGDIKGTPKKIDKQMGEVVTTGGIATSQVLNSFRNGQKIKIKYNLLKTDDNVELLKEQFNDEEKVQGESAGEYAVRNLMRRTTENIHNKIMNPNYKLKKGK